MVDWIEDYCTIIGYASIVATVDLPDDYCGLIAVYVVMSVDYVVGEDVFAGCVAGDYAVGDDSSAGGESCVSAGLDD